MRKKCRKHPIRNLAAIAVIIVVLGGIGAGYGALAAASTFFTSEAATLSQGQTPQTKGSEKKVSLTQGSKSVVQPAKQPKPARHRL